MQALPKSFLRLGAFTALLGSLFGACFATSTSGQDSPGKGVVTSLTIYPVPLAGEAHQEFGEALGLVLEQKGLASIAIADATFAPEKDASLDDVAKAFGAFVVAHPIATEHALFAEFMGSRDKGFTGVRGVVVDKSGAITWKDAQTAADPDWKRMHPADPLTCCTLVAERLAPTLVLGKPPGDRGAMAQLWAAKSALPRHEELEAMAGRLEALKASGAAARVRVYSVRLGNEVSRAGAEQLAKLLRDEKLCDATVADEEWSVKLEPSSNEQRVLWDMARAVQANVREKQPESDYVLFADYLFAAPGQVGAVHFTICDRHGDWVLVDMQNDHHDDFKAIAPKTADDCGRLVARRLAGKLR